jgi:hypothetical protein
VQVIIQQRREPKRLFPVGPIFGHHLQHAEIQAELYLGLPVVAGNPAGIDMARGVSQSLKMRLISLLKRSSRVMDAR